MLIQLVAEFSEQKKSFDDEYARRFEDVVAMTSPLFPPRLQVRFSVG